MIHRGLLAFLLSLVAWLAQPTPLTEDGQADTYRRWAPEARY